MKKTYKAPSVTEWGEVMKLTQGLYSNWCRNREQRRIRRRMRNRDCGGNTCVPCGSH